VAETALANMEQQSLRLCYTDRMNTIKDIAKCTLVTRRTFMQGGATLGLLAGAAPLLAACAPVARPASSAPVILPTTTPTGAAARRSRVALVRTDDRADGVRRAIGLFGLPALTGKRLLLKPNFNSADPAPGSTHPAVLRTLAELLQAQAPAQIVVADRSGMGNTHQVMAAVGAVALAEELGLELIALDELDRDAWAMVDAPGSHWRQGFALPRLALDADAIIMACCLKTHRFGGHFTLSLKNGVGLAAKQLPGDSYNYMNELHSSPLQRTLIAEINATFAPALVVIDGVAAFVSGGPDSGDQVAANVVLAGSDRIALDAVGVAILRHFGTTAQVSAGPIFGQEQIARAAELGLGVSGPEAIDLVTDDDESAAFAAIVAGLLQQG
jgi:uncharacterized protein (DUF362 family)